MPTYLVTVDRPSVPDARITAPDLYELGHQVAVHLTRHRLLRRGLPYDAQVGNDRGALTQTGLQRPVVFTFTKES